MPDRREQQTCVGLDGAAGGSADALPVAFAQPRVSQRSDEWQVLLEARQLLPQVGNNLQRRARQLLGHLGGAAHPAARAGRWWRCQGQSMQRMHEGSVSNSSSSSIVVCMQASHTYPRQLPPPRCQSLQAAMQTHRLISAHRIGNML